MSDEATELSVAFVTLGCARNDVDSDEIAGRLTQAGWRIVEDPDEADAVLVNTCGFVEAAKRDSIDTVLQLQDSNRPVVAVGCLAERYGNELAKALPEADAVLGFGAYPDIAARLRAIVGGERPASHAPVDRRKLLSITPTERQGSPVEIPGHYHGRVLLEAGPVASLKIASGCDRRCTFCAIPSFRGAFVSRRPTDVLDEAKWLVSQGVAEINLVSENSTSYGKDLGDLKLLETLLPQIAGLGPDLRVRLAYLQPAEMRPGLIEVMAGTEGIASYFDLSFQHASPAVLRRMKRFGGIDDFLQLIGNIRNQAPAAGIRTNVIVGFPGESSDDLAVLEEFLERAELDAVGVFGYSDEDGTAALKLADKLSAQVIAERVERVSALVAELSDQRAEARLESEITVLVEAIDQDGNAFGRAEHQGPEDGEVTLHPKGSPRVGQVVRAKVVQTVGVDLVAQEV